MFKLILCLVIISCCGTMGMLKSHTYTQRINELNDIKNMIYQLKGEISYKKDPLIHIFRRLSKRNTGISSSIMYLCSQNMDSFSDFNICWSTAVRDACEHSCLTDNDKDILYEISTLLGKSDIQGQQSMFDLIEEKLSLQISEASDDRNSKGKMYGGLGFSLGIVISVLMI